MEKPRWKVLSSSYVVDSPFMRLRCDEVELPNGTVIPEYFVRESDGFVFVVPFTPDGKVVLTEQYRYGCDGIGIELPAGTLDPGEDELLCARRELLEETGYEAERFEFIGRYYAEPVRSSAQCRVFLAFGARRVAEQSLDSTECIEVFEATVEELRATIADGRMSSLGSVAAALIALDVLRSRETPPGEAR